ncbi:MAG: F0F1 ATP synthase subunit B [Nitrospirae bacterium]|nr:F0F1 ATP synthase subunit B [Nitrospirota bacterium]
MKIRFKMQDSRCKMQDAGYRNYLSCIVYHVSCIIFPFLLFSLFTVALAFASEEAGHSASLKDWLWPVVNFAILVFILVKFGRKPISEFLRKRTELIEKSLKEAEEAKELAKKALGEVQERLRAVDEEINKILESARKAGEREREALIAQGKSLKNKILEQTKANIDYELQKAKKAIKSEAALMAIEIAERQIKEKLNEKEQVRLIEEYIKKFANGS